MPWEYLRAHVSGHGEGNEVRVLLPDENGIDGRAWHNADELGNDGWEMVSIIETEKKLYTGFFKRFRHSREAIDL